MSTFEDTKAIALHALLAALSEAQMALTEMTGRPGIRGIEIDGRVWLLLGCPTELSVAGTRVRVSAGGSI